MDSTAEKLAEAVLKNYPKAQPEVRVSISKTHPHWRDLWELSKVLATRQKYASGLEVAASAPLPGAEEGILHALRKLIPNLDRFLEKLAESKPELRAPSVPELYKLAGILLPILAAEGVVPKGSILFPFGPEGLPPRS